MQLHAGKSYNREGIEVSLFLFDRKDYLKTLLQINPNSSVEERTEFTVWIIYQDQHTLQIVSEYYLMNHKDKNKKNLFDSMRRMFSTKAQILYGRLYFEFKTECGISKNDLKRAVCFIEDGFVKIGLRN